MTKSFSLAEEIKLISKVAETPSIYDPELTKFLGKSKRAEIWESIAGQLNKRANDCKDLWYKLCRDYANALRLKRLQLGDPETWTCRHYDLLDSFVKMKQKTDVPVIESFYTVEPSSMDGDTIDDLQQNGRKDQDSLQNGGQDLLQNCGEYVHQDEVGDSVANSSFQGQSAEGVQYVELTGPDQGHESLASRSHQKSSDDDEWVDVLVDQGFIEQRRQPRSTTIKSVKQKPRTSSRVKNPVSRYGAVNDEVILEEEQNILQQYHSRLKEKGGGGDVLKSKRKKKAPMIPKRRRIAAAAKRELIAENELVHVETLDKYSRGSKGTKPPPQSSGNQRPRSSKNDRPQSVKGQRSRSRIDGGPQSVKGQRSRPRIDGGPQSVKGQRSRPRIDGGPQSVKGQRSRPRIDGGPQSVKGQRSRPRIDGGPQSVKGQRSRPRIDGGPQSVKGQRSRSRIDGGPQSVKGQRSRPRIDGGPQATKSSNSRSIEPQSVKILELRVVLDDLNNNSRLLGDQHDAVVSRNLQAFDGTSRNLQEFDDVALFSRHISSVLRGFNPLQRAMAKRDLSTVLSHFEISKAKNVPTTASSSNGGHQGFVENVVRSSAMDSMLSNPALKFIGNQM